MHLNLATRDLDASVAFYKTLLAAEPTKQYRDYALFFTENSGLELALNADPSVKVGRDAHYGVVVERTQDVDAAIARLPSAGRDLVCRKGGNLAKELLKPASMLDRERRNRD